MKLPIIVLLSFAIGLSLGALAGLSIRMGEVTTLTTYLTETLTHYTTSTYIFNLTSHIPELSKCVAFSTVKEVFNVSEPIKFFLVNNCTDVVVLSNSAPWRIEDLYGRTTFKPISLQIMVEVRAGDKIEWSWDQRDGKGNLVPPGKYYIVIDTVNKGSFRTSFSIA